MSEFQPITERAASSQNRVAKTKRANGYAQVNIGGSTAGGISKSHFVTKDSTVESAPGAKLGHERLSLRTALTWLERSNAQLLPAGPPPELGRR